VYSLYKAASAAGRVVAIAIVVVTLRGNSSQTEDAKARLGDGLEDLRQARFEVAEQAFRDAVRLDPTLMIAQYDLAICYFAQGHFDDAEEAFRQTLRLAPTNRFADYYLARIDLIQNRLAQAISSLEALVRGGPVADELYYLGSAYFRQGNFAVAIQQLERAVRSNPNDSRVHYLLARAYRRAGRDADGKQELRRSDELRAYSQKDAQQIATCESALQSLPKEAAINECKRALDGSDPVKLSSLGMLLAQKGELETAVDPLVRATRLDSEDYESHFNLGLVYVHLKRYADAEQSLGVAVSLQPESFEAVALLGSALFGLGDDLAAVDQLRHAHQLQPDNTKVINLLLTELQIVGQHAVHQGEFHRAAGYLENTSELAPDSPQLDTAAVQLATESFAHLDYGTTVRALRLAKGSIGHCAECQSMLGYSHYKVGDGGAAVAELQRAMDLDKKNQDYVLELAEVLVANNNPEAARTLLEAATQAFSQSAKVWFALGVSCVAADHPEDGEKALQRSHELDPQLDLVYVVLGQMYRNGGSWDKLYATSEQLIQLSPANYLGYFYKSLALSRQSDADPNDIQGLLERSSALDPDDPEPHYELAKLLSRKGEKEAAVKELQKIVGVNSHYAQAYYQLYRLYAEQGKNEESAEAEQAFERLRQERGQAVRKLLVRVRER